MRSKTISVSIRRAQRNAAASSQDFVAQDFVAVEEPLQIRVNGRNLAITMRTPGDDAALAAGFLFTEGLIETASQIVNIDDDGRGTISVELTPDSTRDQVSARNFYMTSSCGVCGKASVESLRASGCTTLATNDLRVESHTLASLPHRLRDSQIEFDRTGGLHAAGLFDAAGTLLDVREDVGRHNAVDKLIGAALLSARVPLETHILMLSGRVSFELVQKALRARIPVIAAIGAPSSLAVETARRFSITLAGFVRDERFNIYSGEERIEHHFDAGASVIPDSQ